MKWMNNLFVSDSQPAAFKADNMVRYLSALGEKFAVELIDIYDLYIMAVSVEMLYMEEKSHF